MIIERAVRFVFFEKIEPWFKAFEVSTSVIPSCLGCDTHEALSTSIIELHVLGRCSASRCGDIDAFNFRQGKGCTRNCRRLLTGGNRIERIRGDLLYYQ
ncbi:hypothetical protein HMPREF2822_08595 [Corynebacterium sp. HMSC062E11]|nr:hypothetical protein HMPREF2822_08595 [Corynebacterium sp. HMSC062E11]OFK95378.1 hypothetical protein HMPREF2792_06380 [Corynebacterium sp. HMSC068H04]OFM29031.1 hypothetical protein HMPREF2698_04095 [Corynebacterium sp. HMSC072A02]OFN20280.1 hypothetical protein HMPREF2604_03960 [Corynebacterium sp. HMSC055A01]OFP70862.1 hypothetical protein HMPREF2974_12025 [Corynebacterium sp. HMSC078C09]